MRVLRRALPDLKWVNPAGIHLTLKFLGEITPAQAEQVKAGVQKAASGGAFTLRVGQLGCFPNPRRPKVLWVGIEGEVDKLQQLRDTVEAEIAPLGFPTEDRPFNPHLTLARTHRRTALEALATHEIGHVGEWHISELSVMRSVLKPTGAEYTALGTYQL